MTKREYFESALYIAKQDPRYVRRLIEQARAGDIYLRPIHAALCALALRKVGKL